MKIEISLFFLSLCRLDTIGTCFIFSIKPDLKIDLAQKMRNGKINNHASINVFFPMWAWNERCLDNYFFALYFLLYTQWTHINKYYFSDWLIFTWNILWWNYHYFYYNKISSYVRYFYTDNIQNTTNYYSPNNQIHLIHTRNHNFFIWYIILLYHPNQILPVRVNNVRQFTHESIHMGNWQEIWRLKLQYDYYL